MADTGEHMLSIRRPIVRLAGAATDGALPRAVHPDQAKFGKPILVGPAIGYPSAVGGEPGRVGVASSGHGDVVVVTREQVLHAELTSLPVRERVVSTICRNRSCHVADAGHLVMSRSFLRSEGAGRRRSSQH